MLKDLQKIRRGIIESFHEINEILPVEFNDTLNEMFWYLEVFESKIEFSDLKSIGSDLNVKCPFENCKLDSLSINVYKLVAIVIFMLALAIISFCFIFFFIIEFKLKRFYKNY
jgi:hypothetical protein